VAKRTAKKRPVKKKTATRKKAPARKKAKKGKKRKTAGGRAKDVDARDRVLEKFGDTGSITLAAKAAGVNRHTVHTWRREDKGFAKRFEEARQVAVTMLEDEAVKLAKNRSERMIQFLLRCWGSERYVERRKNEHTGAGGAPLIPEGAVVITADKLKELPLDVLRALRTVAAGAAQPHGD